MQLPVYDAGQRAFQGVYLPEYAAGDVVFQGVYLPEFVAGELAFTGIKLPSYVAGSGIPPTQFTHTPTGGIGIGGTFGDPAVHPAGGMGLGGTAPNWAVIPFTHVPTGGLSITGAAGFVFSQHTVAAGGVSFAGAAVIVDKYPQHVPTGGVKFGVGLTDGGKGLYHG